MNPTSYLWERLLSLGLTGLHLYDIFLTFLFHQEHSNVITKFKKTHNIDRTIRQARIRSDEKSYLFFFFSEVPRLIRRVFSLISLSMRRHSRDPAKHLPRPLGRVSGRQHVTQWTAAWSVTLQRATTTTRPHRPSPVLTSFSQKHQSLHMDQSLHGTVGKKS